MATTKKSNASDIALERTNLCFQTPVSGLQRRKYQRYAKSHSTYLGLIACVIQKSPDRRLTFCQIMESLEPFVSGDRRGLINNIRVCLSSNDCFFKVPLHPEIPSSKKNFWKVDATRITPKMLRRHLKGMLDTFPHFASRLKSDRDATEKMHAIRNPQKPSVFSAQKGSVGKFTGPFSIESILKADTRPRLCPKSSERYILPDSLAGRDQGLKRAWTGLGIKWISTREESEFQGHMNENANSMLSTTRCGLQCSSQEICSMSDRHDAFRPMKRMRMCPVLSDTRLPREVIASQRHRAVHFNFQNHLLYPLSANSFGHFRGHFGL